MANEHYFDVLFIGDDKDYTKVYLNRMMAALKSVTPPLRIGRECLNKTNGIQDFRTEKAIFMTFNAASYTIDWMQNWMKMLRTENNKQPRMMLISQGHQECVSLVLEELQNVQVVQVDDLRNIEMFWPQAIRFLFNIRRPNKGIYYRLYNSKDLDASSKCVINESLASIKACLSQFNVPEIYRRQKAATSLVTITKGYARENKNVDVKKLLEYDLAAIGHTTHVLVYRKETIKQDDCDDRETVHEYHDTLACILWILVDVGCVKCGRGLPMLSYSMRFNAALTCCKKLWLWFALLLAILLNMPAYLAYCCNPLTPFIFSLCKKTRRKKRAFVYISNVVLTIAASILLGILEEDIFRPIGLIRFVCFLSILYFFGVQTIAGVCLYYLYDRHRLFRHHYGLLRLPIKAWKSLNVSCDKLRSVLELVMNIVGIINYIFAFVSFITILIPSIPFLILFCFCCLLAKESAYIRTYGYMRNFINNILVTVIVWVLYDVNLLSLSSTCFIYLSCIFYISGIATLVDNFVIRNIFECNYSYKTFHEEF